jgi:hypothetical protein
MINKADTIKLSAPDAKVRFVVVAPNESERRFGERVEGIVCQNVRMALNAWYYEQGGAS